MMFVPSMDIQSEAATRNADLLCSVPRLHVSVDFSKADCRVMMQIIEYSHRVSVREFKVCFLMPPRPEARKQGIDLSNAYRIQSHSGSLGRQTHI